MKKYYSLCIKVGKQYLFENGCYIFSGLLTNRSLLTLSQFKYHFERFKSVYGKEGLLSLYFVLIDKVDISNIQCHFLPYHPLNNFKENLDMLTFNPYYDLPLFHFMRSRDYERFIKRL